MGHKIEWVGPVENPSGYGAFARSFILAMNKRGMKIQVLPVSFDTQKPELGAEGKEVESLINGNRKGVNISILNMTPEFWQKFKNPNPGVINIGFTMFETTRIPDIWVTECNKMDAIFVPCQWNVEVFKDSGVTIPIYCISPGVEPEKYEDKLPTNKIATVQDGTFLFYSIFQWTPRKNPEALLRAYWSEFSGVNDVCLILKTYLSNTSQSEQVKLKSIIANIKSNINLKHYPRIIFIGGLLSNEEIADVHRTSNCLVLPTRAEGFGLPQMEAMAYGRTVISTNFSGNTDFQNKDNSYLLDYQLTPVQGMTWCPWYEGDMLWADPDVYQLKKYMREVYTNRDEAKRIGLLGQKELFQNFNWDTRIKILRETFKKIVSEKK